MVGMFTLLLWNWKKDKSIKVYYSYVPLFEVIRRGPNVVDIIYSCFNRQKPSAHYESFHLSDNFPKFASSWAKLFGMIILIILLAGLIQKLPKANFPLHKSNKMGDCEPKWLQYLSKQFIIFRLPGEKSG